MVDEWVRKQFPGAVGYLNTASLGLPPQVTVDALSEALSEWQAGRAQAPAYDAHVAAARASFAELAGVPVEWVATGAQVSAMAGMAATVLRPGSRILCPEEEFTSVLFPFLVRDDLRLELVTAPLERLAESIDPDTDLVAFSSVQSADGRVADLQAIRAAAAANDALTLVDTTQGTGWLPLDAGDWDITVTGAYKWLLSPRGTAFMTVRPELLERIQPLYAGWYAGEAPWNSIYGLPLRLASNASRLDLSPAWHPWIGTAPSLRLLGEVGIERIHAHDVGLANALRERLDMEPADSAMVSLELRPDFDPSRLDGLSTAFRAGRLRVGFHLYNSDEDLERLVVALTG